ncbi:hypothetical protein [Chitinophaga qingshengii]|uniref:Uncharacterized protein n=1 Tax=Chitinophaga qingshengii TaxID=1569794 RepID=A0ABR7TGF4_9BACT|nr:hypothetical protein [Chitinophaga qingshengii]MBC9929536.1 hypothetical protein [Chitinophaga qingshengii]
MKMPVLVMLYEQPRGDTRLVAIKRKLPPAAPVVPIHTPFLSIHGNVMYDFYYQSHTDTPYLEKEIYQHTLQTTLDILVKDRYPLHLTLNTNRGNSYLFRDITGINFRYTQQDFRQLLLAKARDWDAGKRKQIQELERLKVKLDQQWDELNKLRYWFNSPAQLQRMVELKEKAFRQQVNDSLQRVLTPEGYKSTISGMVRKRVDSLKSAIERDSIDDRFLALYEEKKKKLDSLEKTFAVTEKLYAKQQQTYTAKKGYLMDVLQHSKNPRELMQDLEAMNLPDSILPKGYKTLLAIKSAGIGRTMVDYSELTAKNISITGGQAEFNPSYYIAFATGAVDYRFRDFIVNDNRIRQYLNIIRAGVGQRDDNHIILSFYTGKKQVYNFNTTAPGNGAVEMPDFRIMGMSLEGRWQIDRNNYLIGEVAKSSLPFYERKQQHSGLGSSMASFGDRSNEAYAVSGFSFIPLSKTRVNAMFKRMGANFQSFSLYASGAAQNAWMIKVDQPFFQQQLIVTGSLKQNVYTSIFEHSSYRSSTVFKSIQATFRRKKWPVVSVGYYPTSQLMKLSDDRFVENLFYTMSGTASYNYQSGRANMNTIFSGTRFYNRQADSNFVYFNSTNLLLSHTVFIGKFTLNGGLSSATNQDYALYGADGGIQYRITNWLEIGGGVKYNYQTVYQLQQTGYSANTRINIPKVGEIALMADKGFVPGVNRQLVSNETGRLTYTRVF